MTTSNRIEHDSLGEVFVPSNTLYGAQTQRAIENFPMSGLKPRQPFMANDRELTNEELIRAIRFMLNDAWQR